MAVTIAPATVEFLIDLNNHNTREWFADNKKRYEAAKKNFEAFVEALITECTKFDPKLEGLLVKQATFRINRDTRFSANKDPYKNNMGASLQWGGKNRDTGFAGYYFHLQPGASFIAGGAWMPEAPYLKKIRDAIDYDPETFDAIVKDKKVQKLFKGLSTDAQLKTAPKGYPKDHPYLDYLKHKSFILETKVDDKLVTSPKLIPTLVEYFEAIKPLVYFIKQAYSYTEE